MKASTKRGSSSSRQKTAHKAARRAAPQKRRTSARTATTRGRGQQATRQRTPRGRQQPIPVRDVMTRDVQTVSPEAMIVEAAEKMKAFNVGAIPIAEGDHLLGMITDRDIAIRIVAERRDAQTTKVSEVMSPEPICCFEDQSIEEAARLMTERQIRRLPVLDREQRLVGLVSLDDLAARAGEHALSGRTLEEVAVRSEK